jgi:hypothetical protein
LVVEEFELGVQVDRVHGSLACRVKLPTVCRRGQRGSCTLVT